jgi:hypothetical protein
VINKADDVKKEDFGLMGIVFNRRRQTDPLFMAQISKAQAEMKVTEAPTMESVAATLGDPQKAIEDKKRREEEEQAKEKEKEGGDGGQQ